MATPPADMADLYRKLHVCMVRVTTVTADGTLGCGAAFHIGDGWLATARHVIDHGELEELAQHDRPDGLVCERIIYPDDEDVDLALLHTNFDLTHYMTKTTIVGLGGISKQRADKLLERGREVAARQSTVPLPEAIVAAIVTSRRGVLVTQRLDGVPPWGFVTGKIEPGESPADAAVREVKEETGLEVQHGEIIGQRLHPVTKLLVIYMTARMARAASTEVFNGDLTELTAVRWMNLAEAAELLPDMYEPVRKYLGRVVRGPR